MDKEDEKDMATAKTKEPIKNAKIMVRLNPEFLAMAKRLPVKNGKIILDRENPEHVEWDTED